MFWWKYAINFCRFDIKFILMSNFVYILPIKRRNQSTGPLKVIYTSPVADLFIAVSRFEFANGLSL